jgi:hypothetical protein
MQRNYPVLILDFKRLLIHPIVCGALACLVSSTVSSSAEAGAVAPDFVPSFDFDRSGTSDVLLHKVSGGGNVGINEVQTVSGGSGPRGWPDLNRDSTGALAYTTLGAGRFDPTLGTQAQIITRMTLSGAHPGLLRIVRLSPNGISPHSQWFVSGVSLDWGFVGVGDLNGDGADDIVFHKVSGPNLGTIRMLFMDPSNPIATLVLQDAIVLPSNNVPLGVADADGDGRADLFTMDVTNSVVEVLITSDTAASGGGFASTTMLTMVPSGYEVRGIGLFNRADSRADILLENVSNPQNPGLLRIDYAGDGGSMVNAPPSSFPALLYHQLGETTVGIGDYDGMNQQDLLTRLTTPLNNANIGALTVRLMNSDGDDLAGSAYQMQKIEHLEYEVVNGSPELGP